MVGMMKMDWSVKGAFIAWRENLGGAIVWA